MVNGATSCVTAGLGILAVKRTDDADTDQISMSQIAKRLEAFFRTLFLIAYHWLFTRYKSLEQATFHCSPPRSGWPLKSNKAAIAPTASASNTSTAVVPQTGPFGTVEWVLDSGSSFCVTGDPNAIRGLHSAEFVSATSVNGKPMGSELCGHAVGNVRISGVRYFDGAEMNLISSGWLVRRGCDIRHTREGVQIWKGDVIVGSGRLLDNNLWSVEFLDDIHLDGPACTICRRLRAQPLLLEGGAADAICASDDAESSRAEYGMKEGKAKRSDAWYIAIGAARHATGNRDLLSGFIMEHDDDQFVHVVNGVPRKVVARGAVITDTVVLPDVRFEPGLTLNLVSVAQLADIGYIVTFSGGECCIRSTTDGKVVGKGQNTTDGKVVGKGQSTTDGKVVGKGHRQEGGLYKLDFLKVPLAI